MGSGTCYQVGFAGVACGIARGAPDCFLDVARNKVPRGAKARCATCRGADQSGPGRSQSARRTRLRAAVDGDIWKDLCAGDMITVEQRITVRMAATHDPQGARGGRLRLRAAAGATAIFEHHPLERRFRDITP
jgi:hypothetical protein